MTDLPARIACAAASGLFAAGLVAFAAPAHARSVPVDTVPQRIVASADLNLASPAGRATLERRVSAAASSVCSEATVPTQCRRDAMSRAMREAGLDG